MAFVRFHGLVAIALFFFAQLATAGLEARGFEFLSFYNAYRAEVDVLTAGGMGEEIWTLLKMCFRLASDFKDGKLDTSKKGCNIIGFMRHALESSPNRDTPKNTINDLWAPTNEEVRNYHKWPPLIDGGHNRALISFDDYFGIKGGDKSWSNAYSKIGRRLDELHNMNPDVVMEHLGRFQENLKYARYAREREAAAFQIDRLKDKLKFIDKTATGMARTKPGEMKLGWTTGYDKIDKNATKKGFTLGMEKMKKARDLMDVFANNYRISIYDSADKVHADIIDVQKSLRAAISRELKGRPSVACEFP